MRAMLKIGFAFLTLCALILDAAMLLTAFLIAWGIQ